MQAISGETYEFSAKPKVIKQRTKYREQQNEEQNDYDRYNNLMFDKRIVRGNTYAPIVTSKNQEQFRDSNKLARSIKQPQNQQREVEQQQEFNEPGTPDAVQGRAHVSLQTDEYVETLTDKPPNYEKDTQTDFYIDRPLLRLFMPQKTGKDVETQIMDGDLFDFDYEVEPILQVLIGKTLEQSRMEVLEEEELRIMKEQQKRFEQLRNAELAEMQKLEAKERRLLEENQHRKAQYKAKLEQNVLSHKKMISRIIAKNYLGKLQPTVVDILKDQGVFRHPLQMTLLHQFMPWVFEQIQGELQQNQNKRQTIQELVQFGIEESKKVHQESLEKEAQRRRDELERRRLEEEEKERKRQERREEKRRKLERERRQRLKEQALEQLVSKGEQRPNLLSLNIADIDNHSNEAPAVGLFGGLVGELVLFSACIAKNTQDQGLKEFLQTNENVVNMFKDLVGQICQEGGLEIQVDENIDQELQNLFKKQQQGEEGEQQEGDQEGGEQQQQDENQVGINNWHLQGEEQQQDIQNVIKDNIQHLILNTIKANSEQLEIDPSIVDQCVSTLLKLINSEDSVQQKIKWVKVTKKTSFDQVGIAFMKPDLSSLQVNSKSERYGEQQEPQNEDEEPKPVVPINLAEADYENKQTLFNQNGEEIRVLTQHAVAELIVREDILQKILQQVTSLQGNEFQLLMDSIEWMKQFQMQVLDLITPDYPVLDMDSY